MNLKVLGTGSLGNCYLLEAKDQTLIIEAGIKDSELIAGLHYDISKQKGCIITHEHGDHAKYAKQYELLGIELYSSQMTLNKLGVSGTHIPVNEWSYIYDFVVYPFPIDHDAADPYGYIIYHPECGYIMFLTDTNTANYKLSVPDGFTSLIIESNYDSDCLKAMDNRYLADRIANNHLSIKQTINIINNNNSESLENVILIHLSRERSNVNFVDRIKQHVPDSVFVAIAQKNSNFSITKVS